MRAEIGVENGSDGNSGLVGADEAGCGSSRGEQCALRVADGNDSSGALTVADGNGGSSGHVGAGYAGCGNSSGEHCALRTAAKKAATGTADTSARAMPAAAAAEAGIAR